MNSIGRVDISFHAFRCHDDEDADDEDDVVVVIVVVEWDLVVNRRCSHLLAVVVVCDVIDNLEPD
jgi:hypothetical protein